MGPMTAGVSSSTGNSTRAENSRGEQKGRGKRKGKAEEYLDLEASQEQEIRISRKQLDQVRYGKDRTAYETSRSCSGV